MRATPQPDPRQPGDALAPPSPPFVDGRDGAGRFLPGNRFGRGNPHAARVAQLRSALLEETDEAAFRGVVRALVAAATGGDVAAARLLLEYTLGRPATPVEVSHEASLSPVKVIYVRSEG